MVERDPGDMMLDRVGVRDLFSNADFNLYQFAGLEWREERYDRDMLFGFPVGGFDEGREHFVYFLSCRRSGKSRTLKGVCSSWSWSSGAARQVVHEARRGCSQRYSRRS